MKIFTSFIPKNWNDYEPNEPYCVLFHTWRLPFPKCFLFKICHTFEEGYLFSDIETLLISGVRLWRLFYGPFIIASSITPCRTIQNYPFPRAKFGKLCVKITLEDLCSEFIQNYSLFFRVSLIFTLGLFSKKISSAQVHCTVRFWERDNKNFQ